MITICFCSLITKYKSQPSYFFGDFSRFLAKTLKVNKIVMKSFEKNLSFGVDFKL